MRLRTKRRPPGVAEHASHGSARSEPASTVEIDNRSSPAEAGVDRLTGVLNRVHFEARLSEELEKTRGFGDCFVLVFFDIDEFRTLNGAHGRQMGDDALVLMAQALRSNARRVDVVARYGSDEFVVLMPGTPLVGARDFFEKIRAEVAKRSMLELGFTVHLSAGAVKLLHDITGDPQDLLETASHAMYVAKRQGKDRLFTTVAVGHAENGREADPGREVRVLLANKPRSYREAFARVFEEVRPRVEAIAVEPGALDREALRLRPDLVVCDHVTPTVETVARSWIELRVEDEVLVAISNAGALPAGTNLGLDDLLSVIDRTEELINGESLGRGEDERTG